MAHLLRVTLIFAGLAAEAAGMSMVSSGRQGVKGDFQENITIATRDTHKLMRSEKSKTRSSSQKVALSKDEIYMPADEKDVNAQHGKLPSFLGKASMEGDVVSSATVTVEWVMEGNGDSTSCTNGNCGPSCSNGNCNRNCDKICAAKDRICDQASIDGLTTTTKIHEAFQAAGFECKHDDAGCETRFGGGHCARWGSPYLFNNQLNLVSRQRCFFGDGITHKHAQCQENHMDPRHRRLCPCAMKATCDSFTGCGTDKVKKASNPTCPGDALSCTADLCCEPKDLWATQKWAAYNAVQDGTYRATRKANNKEDCTADEVYFRCEQADGSTDGYDYCSDNNKCPVNSVHPSPCCYCGGCLAKVAGSIGMSMYSRPESSVF